MDSARVTSHDFWVRVRVKVKKNGLDSESSKNGLEWDSSPSPYSSHTALLNKYYESLSGSSFIPLPQVLQSKKAIVNVKSKEDNECFKWSITTAMYPVENHPEKFCKQLKENSEKFNWDGIHFLASFKQTDTFEEQNPSISINVFSYEQEVSKFQLGAVFSPKVGDYGPPFCSVLGCRIACSHTPSCPPLYVVTTDTALTSSSSSSLYNPFQYTF